MKSQGKNYQKKFDIPAGQSKISISLADAKVDTSAIKYIKIWIKKPAEKIILYIDNIVFK